MIKDPDFFIVGLQKCATYTVDAILDAHPQIRCLPNHPIHNYTKGKTGADEGRIFDMLASYDNDGGAALKNSFLNHHGGFFANIVDLIGKASKEEVYEAVKKRYKEWFEFQNPENKPIVGDKTTEYVFHLDMIDDFFPKAKKLCIIRDPKDRVISWHFHQIRQGRKNEKEKITDDFIIDYIENRIRKEYENLMAYKGFIFLFTCEDLQIKPKEVVKNILSFLGADTDERLIDKMLIESSFKNMREKEILFRESMGESSKYLHFDSDKLGDWKNYLDESQAEMIDGKIGKLQEEILKKYHIK